MLPDAPSVLGIRYRPPTLPAKEPGDDLNYGVNFRLAIGGRQVIESVSFWLSPMSVSILASRTYGQVVAFRVVGGRDNEPVTIGITALLSDGQIISRSVVLPIIARMAPAPMRGRALTINGVRLTIGGTGISFDPPLVSIRVGHTTISGG